MYKPYTYLIGWSALNKYYYGVRYSKKAYPGEFWVTYFTSSKEVKKFRITHGEPDIIQIRKTFFTSESAKHWEFRVLQRLKVRKSDKWLNQCENLFPFNTKDRSYTRTPEYRKKISDAKKGQPAWNKGKSNINAKGKKFYNDGLTHGLFIPGNEPHGWVLGRVNQAWNIGKKHSQETKDKISLKSKQPRGPMSEEQKQKRRDAWARGCYSSLLRGKGT